MTTKTRFETYLRLLRNDPAAATKFYHEHSEDHRFAGLVNLRESTLSSFDSYLARQVDAQGVRDLVATETVVVLLQEGIDAKRAAEIARNIARRVATAMECSAESTYPMPK